MCLVESQIRFIILQGSVDTYNSPRVVVAITLTQLILWSIKMVPTKNTKTGLPFATFQTTEAMILLLTLSRERKFAPQRLFVGLSYKIIRSHSIQLVDYACLYSSAK